MSQLPQHVSAVSPIGEALDGTGNGPVMSVPNSGMNRNRPMPPGPSPVWACHAKGCPRQYRRDEAEDITEHLRMHLTGIGPRAAVPFTATPELCAWWLASTKRRRPITEYNWRRIQMDIENGDWIFDGNPFGLDTEGNLVQGGHRATAIVAAGRDVASALMGDLAAVASITMDTSKGQQFSHVLQGLGYAASGELAGVTQLLWRYENGQIDPRLAWHLRVKPSHNMLLRLFYAKEEEIRASLPATRPVRNVTRFTARAAIAVAWIAIMRVASDEATAFFRALALKGEYAPEHGERDPVGAWHRKWARQTRRERMSPEEQMALTIKCWNAYAGSRPVRELVWRPSAGESFPLPVLPLAARGSDEASPAA